MRNLRTRVPLMVVLVGVVAAAFAVGNSQRPTHAPARVTAISGVPASLATKGVRSAAWYCPMASLTDPAPTSDWISLTNSNNRSVAAEVSSIDDSRTLSRERVTIAGNSIVQVRPSSIAKGSNAALFVEAFGGGVVVEHGARIGDHEATNPCATEPSDTWYFAAGTTRKSTHETVAIMNPFGQGAVVDVLLYTTEGVLRPKQFQALEVRARGRAFLDVNAGADQREIVSIVIVARAHRRVVAEAMLANNEPQSGAPFSLQMGVPSLAREWHLPDFDVRRGLSHLVVVTNTSSIAITVNIQTLADGAAEVEQHSVAVAADSVAKIAPTTTSSTTKDFSVIMTSQQDFAVGALHFNATSGRKNSVSNITMSSALAQKSQNWVLGVDRTELLDAAWLLFENDSDQDAHVGIRAEGAAVSQTVTIKKYQRLSVKLKHNTVTAVIVVHSDQRVYVVRRLDGKGGESRTLGVPSL